MTQTPVSPILFTRGVPAVEALPATRIGECLQAVLSAPDGHNVLQYGHHGGYLPLRELLAGQYGVSAENVLVGNGSLHLQDLLSALLVKRGDVVLTEQPSYDRAITTFRRRGARVIGLPLLADGVDTDALERVLSAVKPAFMYVIPDFQNPAGTTTSAAKREKLVAIAEAHDFWLIEDVPYRLLRYRGTDLPLLRDISPRKVLTISSFSKLISPALRVGYVVGDAAIIKVLRDLAEETILAPVLPTQAAVVEFFKRGYFETNLADLKALYAPRLDALLAALHDYLPNISITAPEGGFFVSLILPPNMKAEGLLARAKDVGLTLTDGRGFFADPLEDTDAADDIGGRFVRLPFCALTPDDIREGVRRLAMVLE